MPSEQDVLAAVERGKHEIAADVGSGRVPRQVRTFAELHDYVDANEYGGLTERPFYDEARLDDPAIDTGIVDWAAAARVQELLHQWLLTGSLELGRMDRCSRSGTPAGGLEVERCEGDAWVCVIGDDAAYCRACDEERSRWGGVDRSRWSRRGAVN